MFDDILARSGLGAQIGFVLRMASDAVWSDLTATLAPFKLRPQTFAALTLIETVPGAKQQTIADALGIQRPNMVALIDGLIVRGWVDRQVNSDDRRSYALYLTADGRALLSAARDAHDSHVARVHALLTPAERETLRSAGARLSQLKPFGKIH